MKALTIENIETALYFANVKRVDALMEKYVGAENIHELAEDIYCNIPSNNTDYSEQLDWLRKEING